MKTFKELVEAVEENNRFNDANWRDWNSVDHIEEVYGELGGEYAEVASIFINALIRDDGENVQKYLDAFECLEFSFNFSK